MRVLLNKASTTAMVAFMAVAAAACGGDNVDDSNETAAPESAERSSEAPAETSAQDTMESAAASAMEEAEAAAEEAGDAAESAADKTANLTQQAADEVAAGAEAASAQVASAAEAVEEAAQDAAAGASAALANLTGDEAAGRRVFVKCMACHTVQEGQHRVGPSLYGIIGRTAGTIEGFNYSDANKNSGIVWTEDIMFEYLENPQEYMPGTRMIFPGLPSEQERVDVIAYLKSAAE